MGVSCIKADCGRRLKIDHPDWIHEHSDGHPKLRGGGPNPSIADEESIIVVGNLPTME
jgi:hypothetical protein|tara:strand:+ start:3672 stop:3845 length:174 start_codon:yes stop_codon:yes gene_type:complete